MVFPFLGAFKFVGDLVGGIFGSKQERDQQSHDQAMAGTDLDRATLAQYAGEFAAVDRSLWGSFITGLNKLPRPAIALGVIWTVFAWPYLDPAGFAAYCDALASVPEGYWLLAGVVIPFYFGGRMQIKSQQFRRTKEQAALAAAVMAKRNPWDNPDTRRPWGT